MVINPLPKLVGYSAAVLVAAAFLYGWGHSDGSSKVQASWDKQTKQHTEQLAELRGHVRYLEETHAEETKNLQTELNEVEKTYELRYDDIERTYADRLRLSEARANRYASLAQTGTPECRALASYAAELDLSLEEGRRLVQEFGATLEQRDQQLRLLGQQIINDRKLLG